MLMFICKNTCLRENKMKVYQYYNRSFLFCTIDIYLNY